MKILLTHCDYIEYEKKKKAIESAEQTDTEKERIEECLVAFCSSEAGDDDSVAEKTIDEIKKVAEQVHTKTIVVYPFVHLSSTPAKPAVALTMVIKIAEGLKKDYEVHRSPFGWYKSFELKCKGHPLSELSREIRSDEKRTENKLQTVEESYDPKQLLHQISKMKLDREILKDNDHRILGQKLDLFSFNETAPGMVFWHNNGLIIYNELVNFWREEHAKEGYQEIKTPQVMDSKIWKVSGHWEKYKENNFLTNYEGRPFIVKPMNCPGGMMVFRTGTKSYKDLPLRVGEMGVVHRTELSGVLAGLFRVIQFTQDDAHIFCADEDQAKEEIMGVANLIQRFYKKFALEFDHVELSTRPPKRIGSDELWDTAEKLLEETLKKLNINYKINPGDGAFYGPKIDFHIKDSLGRTWQLSTIQLDFAMPERFELEYVGSDGQIHRPIMLHRVIYGSLERFIGILIEHTNGAFPVWLSPIQVKILSLTDRNSDSAKNICKIFMERGIRAETDLRQNTVDYKIRDAEVQKIPYIIVIGDKEEANNTLAVRARGEKPRFGVSVEEFLAKITKEIENKI